MSKKQILVIDDNPDIVKLIKRILEAENYGVISAGDGKTGLKYAEERLPDAIILDIVLPGMDGFLLCSKIKENEATKYIPLIMMSGVDSGDMLKEQAQSRANEYMPKPFDPAQLLEIIRRVAGKSVADVT